MAIERWQEFTDAELVLAAVLGEIAAFDVLVLRYRPGILATIGRQVSHRGIAEDICQETFLLAFKALPQLSDASRFGAWLYAIARRQAIRTARGEARTAHSELDEFILARSEVLSESGWESLERKEQQSWIRDAVAALPEEFQTVIRLRYWGEMPLERIAAFLGLPLTTVKWRLHRARALMRERLTATTAEADEAAEPPRPEKSVRRRHESGTRRSPSGAAAPCGASR
jgi:RNA polymerase sigma-70 factor (ECF subfamily)